MRVFLYTPKKILKQHLPGRYVNVVKSTLDSTDNIELTDKHPDIVHIFGAWNTQSCKMLNKCCQLNIPTLFSTLEGLTPWQFDAKKQHIKVFDWRKQKKAVKNSSAILVWGPKEAAFIGHKKWNEHVYIVPNSIITSRTNDEQMIARIANIYEQIICSHDKNIRKQIDNNIKDLPEGNEKEKGICADIMYLHYLFVRSNIEEEDLKELTNKLMSTDFDEDVFQNLLEQLHLSPFTSALMQVLSETTKLTEGFMPIEKSNGKNADKIRLSIHHQSTANQ